MIARRLAVLLVATVPAWGQESGSRPASGFDPSLLQGSWSSGAYLGGVKIGGVTRELVRREVGGGPAWAMVYDSLTETSPPGLLPPKRTQSETIFDGEPPYEIAGAWMTDGYAEAPEPFRNELRIELERGPDGLVLTERRFGSDWGRRNVPELDIELADCFTDRIFIREGAKPGDSIERIEIDLPILVEKIRQPDAKLAFPLAKIVVSKVVTGPGGDRRVVCVVHRPGIKTPFEWTYAADGSFISEVGKLGRQSYEALAESRPTATSGFSADGVWRMTARVEGLETPELVTSLVLEATGAAAALARPGPMVAVEAGPTRTVLHFGLAAESRRSAPLAAGPAGAESRAVDDSIRRFATEVAGNRSSDLEKSVALTRAIAARIEANDAPDPVGTARRTAVAVLSSGRGDASDRAALFEAAAAALGIAAPAVEGLASVESSGFVPHAWNEVRVDGRVLVADPTFAACPAHPCRVALQRADPKFLAALPSWDRLRLTLVKQETLDPGVPDLRPLSGRWRAMMSTGRPNAAVIQAMARQLDALGLRARMAESLPESPSSDVDLKSPIAQGERMRYALLPVFIDAVRPLAVRDDWTADDVAMAREVGRLVATYPGAPSVKFEESDHAANRAAVRAIGDWTRGEIAKPHVLAAMIFTMDNGPFVGSKLDPAAEIDPVATARAGDAEILLGRSKAEPVHTVLTCRKGSEVLWSRAICRPDSPLPKLEFGNPPVERIGDAGWVIHMSDGEHLHLYMSPRHEFLFYFHSW